MSNQPLVSTIIPVYNSKKFLRKCLNSVINQTYKNIEIICINDGSTDNSLEILQEYKEKDNRIQTIDIENHGVSYARNLGLEKVTGKYTLFIDSDDYIELNMIEELVNNSKNTNSDLVCCGRRVETTNNKLKQKWLPTKEISNDPMNDYVYFIKFRQVTQKLFKTFIIKDNNLLFDINFNYGEDCIFLIEYLTHCKTITGIKEAYYHCTINTNSLSRNIKYKQRRIRDRKSFENKISQIIQKHKNNFYKEKVLDMDIEKIDFVYLIKPGEKGTDLRYSLRSIAKWYPNNKVWIVGYKPEWVTNVNYLPIKEENKKWKNLVNDLIETCKCEDISDNFIYMNDDFFDIEDSVPLEAIINGNIGLLDDRIKVHENSNKKTGWQKAFKQVGDLLDKLNIEKPYYNYEAHLPLMMNKQKFIEVLSLPQVQDFIQTPNVLHYRTLYKNYDKPENIITFPEDVKVLTRKDTTEEKLKVCGWLSTADGLVGNQKFNILNRTLRKNLSKPCKFEKPIPAVTKVKSKEKFMNF